MLISIFVKTKKQQNKFYNYLIKAYNYCGKLSRRVNMS